MAVMISVIVPVYNTEKYVEECIKSVLAQTYSDFELILIDDGSEDNSREICQRMGEKDGRIHLLQREHRGVSAARNAGMDVAAGKYLFFLDSDDMIHPQLLEALYKVQEENQTVIAAEGWYEAEDGELAGAGQWEMKDESVWESIYLDNEKSIEVCLCRDREITLYGIGGKMILRKAIKSLRFNESLSHSEDTCFIYQLLVGGADVSGLLLKWYYYRSHEMCAIKKFSIAACQSRYKVEDYIREFEMENNRLSNVIYQEWTILSDLIEWHEISRKNKDNNFRNTIEEWFDIEKKYKAFIEMKWWNRLEIYIGIYCYPFYRFIHTVVNSIMH